MAQIRFTDSPYDATQLPGGSNNTNSGIAGGSAVARNPFGSPQTSQPPSAPAPSAPSSFGNPVYDQIAGYFRNQGVDPTQQLVSQWGTNVDNNYMGTIARQIAASYPRQAAPAAPQPQAQQPSAPAAPQLTNWDQNWFASNIGTPSTLNDLIALEPRIMAAGGQVNRNASGQYNGKITTPSGQIVDIINSAGLGGRGFQWLTDAGGGDQGGTYGNNAASDVYQNEILSRLDSLHQPVNDPWSTLLQFLALARVNDLNGAPYTAGDNAALIAQYREPATQARDAAIQQRTEQLAQRGYLPSSGLFQQQVNDIQNQYQRGLAQADNDLGVRAVQQKNANAQEQLAILASLMQTAAGQRSEDDQRSQELVNTAALLPQMDERRLQELLQASGSGDNSQNAALDGLLRLAGSQQQQSQIDQRNQQANASAWGQYLAYALSQLG